MFHFVENLPDATCVRFLDVEDDDLDGYGQADLRKTCERDLGKMTGDSKDAADSEERWFNKYPDWSGKAPIQGGALLDFHEAAYVTGHNPPPVTTGPRPRLRPRRPTTAAKPSLSSLSSSSFSPS